MRSNSGAPDVAGAFVSLRPDDGAVVAEAVPEEPDYTPALRTLLEEGCLARRILSAAGPEPTRDDLHRVYGDLCRCLAENRPFRP